MGGGRKFEAAADHGTVHHRDHRHLAELDLVKHAVPKAGMPDRRLDVVRAQVGQVEPGGEMLAIPVQYNRLHAGRQLVEEYLETKHGLIVEGVALLVSIDTQVR